MRKVILQGARPANKLLLDNKVIATMKKNMYRQSGFKII